MTMMRFFKITSVFLLTAINVFMGGPMNRTRSISINSFPRGSVDIGHIVVSTNTKGLTRRSGTAVSREMTHTLTVITLNV